MTSENSRFYFFSPTLAIYTSYYILQSTHASPNWNVIIVYYIYVLYRNPIKNRRFSESGETYKSCVCGGKRIASAKCGRPFENRHTSIPRAVFIGFIRRVPNHTNTLADGNTRKGSFKRRRSLPIRPDTCVCNIHIPIQLFPEFRVKMRLREMYKSRSRVFSERRILYVEIICSIIYNNIL